MPYSLRSISRRFGERQVFEGFDLDLEPAKMVVILGPSGCGKTTLLRIIAGLDEGFEGSRLGFEDSRFSFAFQEPRLLPWLSVVDNILFALSGSGLEAGSAQERARRLLVHAGLGTRLDSRPHELSGGMRQRVSLVRAFAFPATFLLLDEAFQSVDVRLKQELMRLFLDLRSLEVKSALLVTHDPGEALRLADRVVILSRRPARILDDFPIVLPESERQPGSQALAEYESRIYSGLLA